VNSASTASERPRVGLVLSGGGARGAYEVGVLRYIRERIRVPTRFDVITGTSVGAVNGAYLAATCDRPRIQARLLQRVWTELSVDRVYKVGLGQLRSLPSLVFGRDLPKLGHGGQVGGLVDTSQLEELVRRRIPWPAITQNLRAGHLSAFACTATEISTGIATTFVQSTRRLPSEWSTSPNDAVVPTAISAEQVMASAAIPVLFPAVRVGDQFFVDGMLRQNTPLRPAMRLGANRLLVIGLRRQEPSWLVRRRQREHAQSIYPNLFFLLGKMINALNLDKVETDLERIDRMNQLLRAGRERYGDDFCDDVSEQMGRRVPYREIQTVMIRPSVNIGNLAYDVVRRTGLRQYSGLAARLIRRSLEAERRAEAGGDSDLASYVLFDPTYVGELIDLGFEDARAHHDELMQLFDA
jgi:NTE family protein